jgi:hypothetical protein
MTVVGSYEFNLEDEYDPVGTAMEQMVNQMMTLISSLFPLMIIMMMLSMMMSMMAGVRRRG